MNTKNSTQDHSSYPKNPVGRQQGAAVLAISLILLSIITVIGISSSKTTTIDTKMTTNSIEKQKSMFAAESAINYAWSSIVSSIDIEDASNAYLDVCLINGIYDLRTGAVPSCGRNQAAWDTMSSPANWEWETASKRGAMLDTLSADGSPILLNTAERSNPMKLTRAPQFIIGIHDAIPRPGFAGQSSFPVTIIGAAKGAVNTAQTFIEVKTIPESGYHLTSP